jgi:hypothetical protein
MPVTFFGRPHSCCPRAQRRNLPLSHHVQRAIVGRRSKMVRMLTFSQAMTIGCAVLDFVQICKLPEEL